MTDTTYTTEEILVGSDAVERARPVPERRTTRTSVRVLLTLGVVAAVGMIGIASDTGPAARDAGATTTAGWTAGVAAYHDALRRDRLWAAERARWDAVVAYYERLDRAERAAAERARWDAAGAYYEGLWRAEQAAAVDAYWEAVTASYELHGRQEQADTA